jgi:hypothetical protein
MNGQRKPLVWLHGEIKTQPVSKESRVEDGTCLRRLRRVLLYLERMDLSPESFRVIQVLERMKSPQAKELLQVISKGATGLRSTREATNVLERLK